MRLAGERVTVHELSEDDRKSMFALMEQCYEQVDREVFDHDLSQKEWVIVLRDLAAGRLCGFSTQVVWRTTISDSPLSILFSGDTVVAPDCWGDHSMAHVWGRLALELIDREAENPLYWFLISKGYKTYRYLPLFFHEFYPRRDACTPAWATEILDALALEHFPSRYDPAAGIVRSDASSSRLRPGIADVDPARLKNPEVRFFHERNPGHAAGEELCCLAPITRENFTSAAYRVMGVPGPACLTDTSRSRIA